MPTLGSSERMKCQRVRQSVGPEVGGGEGGTERLPRSSLQLHDTYLPLVAPYQFFYPWCVTVSVHYTYTCR